MNTDAADAIRVPAGYEMALCLRAPAYVVVVAPAGTAPTPEATMCPGSVVILVEHPAGTFWPDRLGVLEANEFLAQGWAVLLSFKTLSDAMACRSRLALERVQ